MALPNPNNSVSPFDIGTSEWANNVKANIDALSTAKGVELTGINGGTNSGVIITNTAGNVAVVKPFFETLTNGTTSRSVTNATTPQLVTGAYKFTNTANYSVKVAITASIMINQSASSGNPRARLDARSGPTTLITQFGGILYSDINVAFVRHCIQGVYTVPANTDIWFGLSMWSSTSGSNAQLTNSTSDVTDGYAPTIVGTIVAN